MKKLDIYLDLHTQVYDLIQPTGKTDAYALFRSYAVEKNGPILEPMCGTGSYLLPLLEEGFDVHGFDASDYMLQALQEKAKKKNLKPTVWKSFIEDLQVNEKYNLIFIASESFCLIIDSDIVKIFLKKIYDHLNNEGLFVFDIVTPKLLPFYPKVWTGELYHRKDGSQIIRNICTMPDIYNIRHSFMKHELINNNQIIQTEVENLKLRLYDPEMLTPILAEIGFRDIKIFSAYHRNISFETSDERVVFECKK